MNVQVMKLKPNAVLPAKGSAKSAGYDLYAAIDEPVTIQRHETKMIGTGLAFELPDNVFGAIFARSGLATKQGLRPANCVGVCDPDYRGEYCVALHNDSTESRVINPGDRIAQLIFMPFEDVQMYSVDMLSETERGCSGFGSTGV